MSLGATHLAETRCILGEGPVWHEGALWFVDIESHTLSRFAEGVCEPFDAGQRIGFAVPTDAGDWIVGLQQGLARWSPGADAPSLIARPEPDASDNRFNDGKADPAGRLFAGTMHMPCVAPAGTLYRVDPGPAPTPVVRGVTISNGLAWDPARGAMYYIDTPTQRIARHDWDPDTGDITNPQVVIEFEQARGNPDGMTIDTEGNLYVAMWGGGAVVVVDPIAGAITEDILVDAPHVTSCTFGGPDLCTLFITSARAGLSQDQIARHPRSGDLFSADVGAKGRPADRVSTGRLG